MTTERNAGIDDLIETAETLASKGAIEEALEYWPTILEEERDAVYLCRFGRLCMKADRFEEARAAFLEAVEVDPCLPYAYDCLGLWHRDQGNLETAHECFSKSVSLKESAGGYTLLGTLQLRLGRITEARESLGKAITIDESYEEAYYNLGLTFEQDQPGMSVTLFRKAIELDPEYAVAHSELGWVLRQQEKYAEAELHLRRAVELDDSDWWAYVYLGNLLWSKGDLEAAERAFWSAAELCPKASPPHWCLASLYENTGRPREADLFYEKALQLDPDDAQATVRFGLFLKEIGETAKARTYLEKTLAIDPDNERAKTALDQCDWSEPTTFDNLKTH